MRTMAATLVATAFLGLSARAQTIVGESTYEDNFLHAPPPAPAEPPRPAAARAPAPDAVPRTDSHPSHPSARQ